MSYAELLRQREQVEARLAAIATSKQELERKLKEFQPKMDATALRALGAEFIARITSGQISAGLENLASATIARLPKRQSDAAPFISRKIDEAMRGAEQGHEVEAMANDLALPEVGPDSDGAVAK